MYFVTVSMFLHIVAFSACPTNARRPFCCATVSMLFLFYFTTGAHRSLAIAVPNLQAKLGLNDFSEFRISVAASSGLKSVCLLDLVDLRLLAAFNVLGGRYPHPRTTSSTIPETRMT